MWKWARKDENNSAPPRSSAPPLHSITSPEPVQAVPTLQSVESLCPNVSNIGKSIVIKGDISGSGDVYLDGELEGSFELPDGVLVVGPEGRIRGDLQARSVVVQGRVNGNVFGLERAELKKSASVVGDIYTPRIAIEDGAVLEGDVRVRKDAPCPQMKKDAATLSGRAKVA